MRRLSILRMRTLKSRDLTLVMVYFEVLLLWDGRHRLHLFIIQVSCMFIAIHSIADVPQFSAIVPHDKDLQ